MAKEVKAEVKAKKPEIKKEAAKKAADISVVGRSITFPHTTEKSIGLIEKENTLVFIVDRRTNKSRIKEDVEKTFGVKVISVKTSITQQNFKKAFVRLAKNNLASEVAIRMGII